MGNRLSVHAKSSHADMHMRPSPSGLFVVGDQLVLDLLDLDEPNGDGTVDQGGVGPPAEGVRVS